INTAIEVAIYTTVGGANGIVVMNLFAAAGCAVAVAALFQPAARATWKDSLRHFAGQWPAARWALRLLLALLAFPLAYFTFGMIVGPFVVDAYRSGHFGLALPD